jgi:ribosomal protein L37AE/L43A
MKQNLDFKYLKERIGPNTSHWQIITFTPQDPSTYASYLLLKQQYRKLDPEVKRAQDSWHYLFIAKRTFLRHRRKDGIWRCHYCTAKLDRMAKRGSSGCNPKIVTIDHVVPSLLCDDPTNSSNWVCCCRRCNQTKGARSYEEFVSTLPKKHQDRIYGRGE